MPMPTTECSFCGRTKPITKFKTTWVVEYDPYEREHIVVLWECYNGCEPTFMERYFPRLWRLGQRSIADILHIETGDNNDRPRGSARNA